MLVRRKVLNLDPLELEPEFLHDPKSRAIVLFIPDCVNVKEVAPEFGPGLTGIRKVVGHLKDGFRLGDPGRFQSPDAIQNQTASLLYQRRQPLVHHQCSRVRYGSHVAELDGRPFPAIGLAAHDG